MARCWFDLTALAGPTPRDGTPSHEVSSIPSQTIHKPGHPRWHSCGHEPQSGTSRAPSTCLGAQRQRKPSQSPPHHERPPSPPCPNARVSLQPQPAAASHSNCCGQAAACLILEKRHVNASKPALFFRVVFAKGCLHKHMHRWDGATATLMSPVAWQVRAGMQRGGKDGGARAAPCDPFPKGLASSVGGIPGLLWAQPLRKAQSGEKEPRESLRARWGKWNYKDHHCWQAVPITYHQNWNKCGVYLAYVPADGSWVLVCMLKCTVCAGGAALPRAEPAGATGLRSSDSHHCSQEGAMADPSLKIPPERIAEAIIYCIIL